MTTLTLEKTMPTVLICDDSLFARTMTRKMLGQAGYDVIGEAEDGDEAVKLYRELQPELLVIDLVMPRCGGADAIRQIRAEKPAAKIVVCSAMGQEGLVREALDAGASGFVTKPARLEMLKTAVSDALR